MLILQGQTESPVPKTCKTVNRKMYPQFGHYSNLSVQNTGNQSFKKKKKKFVCFMGHHNCDNKVCAGHADCSGRSALVILGLVCCSMYLS